MLKGTNYTTLKAAIPDVFDTIDERYISTNDIIEWSAKALGQIDAYEVTEPGVCILNIEDYETKLPCGLLQINQVLYKSDFSHSVNPAEDDYQKLLDTVKCCKAESDLNAQMKIKAFFQEDYIQNCWIPMRSSTNDFALSVLCDNSPNLSSSCDAEFTILPSPNGGAKLVSNCKSTTIIVSYIRAALDENGDYIIPYDDELIEALRLYCMMRAWEKRYNLKEDGAGPRFQDYRERWGLYKNMLRGKFKLPTSDQHQNILYYSTSLLPKKDRYYSYFGNLGSTDTTFF